MPVVVIGAWEPVGLALFGRLVGAGSEVRTVVRRGEPTEHLRALGAKVARGDPSDPELLATALRDAHTLCLVEDGLFLADEEYEPVIAESALSAADAAEAAGLSRLLLLSYPGADPRSENAYLRAKGLAEEGIRRSSVAHMIVRSTLVVAPESRWARVLERGSHRLAPVYVKDLAAVLAAADDRALPVTGTFGLQGPDTVTADELSRLLGRGASRKLRARKPRVSRAAAEILASDSLADAPDAAAEFGVKLTPLLEGLQASGLSPA